MQLLYLHVHVHVDNIHADMYMYKHIGNFSVVI